MDDNRYEIELEVTGMPVLKGLQTELDRITDTYAILGRKVDQYTSSLTAEDAALDRTVRAAAERTRAEQLLRQMLDETTRAEMALAKAAERTAGSTTRAAKGARAAAAEVREAGNASSRAGRGFLEISRGIEDAQYGLGGLVNNIPQAVLMFGGGAGLTAAISLGAVAVNLLVNNWEKLSQALGASEYKFPTIKDGIDGLTESIKKLDKEIEELTKDDGEDKLDYFGEKKLRTLRGLKKEAEERTKDEKSLEATGAGHTTRAEDTAKAVRKAVAELPEGAETLAKNLNMNGMDPVEAGRKVRKAMEGGEAELEEIIKALPNDVMFRGIREATPAEQARKQAEQENREADIKGRENSKKFAREHEDEAVSGLMKSKLSQDLLTPGAEGKPLKSFTGQMEEALKKAGTTGVDAWHALQELQSRIDKQVRQKSLEKKLDLPAARAAVLEDLNKEDRQAEEKRARDREQSEAKFRKDRERRAGGVAGDLDKSPLARAMLMPGAERMNFQPAMKKALEEAGVKDVSPTQAMDALLKKLDEKVTAKSLEMGVGRDAAKAMVLEDTFTKKEMKGEKPQFTGTAEFAKRIQVGALSGGADVPKQQLTTLNQIRELIRGQKKQGAGPAIPAGPF